MAVMKAFYLLCDQVFFLYIDVYVELRLKVRNILTPFFHKWEEHFLQYLCATITVTRSGQRTRRSSKKFTSSSLFVMGF